MADRPIEDLLRDLAPQVLGAGKPMGLEGNQHPFRGEPAERIERGADLVGMMPVIFEDPAAVV